MGRERRIKKTDRSNEDPDSIYFRLRTQQDKSFTASVVPSSVLYRLYRKSRVHDRGFHISIERARAPIILYARVFTLRAHEFVRYRSDVKTAQTTILRE